LQSQNSSALGVDSGVQSGGGATAPGIQGQGGIQRVKLQKLKCCKWMIFPIVSLVIRAVWILFYETFFVVNTVEVA